ncbi:AraC family transcriptional regulator, partial [Rhizobium leguminosarum]
GRHIGDRPYLRVLDGALRLRLELDTRRLESPQLLFSDERVLSLAQLVAAECLNPEPLHDLYGDGLELALIIDVLKIAKAMPRKR